MKKKGNENYSNLGQRISQTNSFRNESNLHSIESIAEQNAKAKYSTDFQILLQHISSRPFSECMQKPEGIINASSSAAVREQCIVYNQMQNYLQSQQEFERLDQFISIPSEQQIEDKGSDKKMIRRFRQKRSQSMQKECIENSPSKMNETTTKIKKETIEKEDIALADEIDALASFIRSKAKRGVVFRAGKKEKIDSDKNGISYRNTIPQNAALTASTITSIGGGSAAKEASRISQLQRERRLIQEIQKQQQQSLQNHENSQQNSQFERGKQLRERVNCLMGRVQVMSDEAKEYLLEQKIIEMNNERLQSDRKKSQHEEHQGSLQKQNSQLSNSNENMTEFQLSPKKASKYPENMEAKYLNEEFMLHPKPRGVSLPQIQLIQKHSFMAKRKQSLASPEKLLSNLSPSKNNNNNNQLFRFSPKSISVQTKSPFQLAHNQLISLSPLILTKLNEKCKSVLQSPKITIEQSQIPESNEFTKLDQTSFEKNLVLTPSIKKPKDQRKITLGGHKSLSLQIQNSPTSSSFNSIQSENQNKKIQSSRFTKDFQNFSKQLEETNKQEDILPKVLENIEIQLKSSNDTQLIIACDEQSKKNQDTAININNKQDNEGPNISINKNEQSDFINQQLVKQNDVKRDSTTIRQSLEKQNQMLQQGRDLEEYEE